MARKLESNRVGRSSNKAINNQRSSKSGIATTVHSRYVFLDIEGFTLDRSVEAQAELVKALNSIVRSSLADLRIKNKIMLPTGDGMCIGILNSSDIDIHVRLALRILVLVQDYNLKQNDPSRQFKLRIGINENNDNLVIDINRQKNLAGAGINIAQRVMSAADGNQIMVGQTVFETLHHREAYMKAFHSYSTRAKHGMILPVHQLVVDAPGLNIEQPFQFREMPRPQPEPQKMSTLVAYYIAHAIRLRSFLTSIVSVTAAMYPSVVLLWYMAEDSQGQSKSTITDPCRQKLWNATTASVEEQFQYYNSANFWLTCDLSHVIDQKLSDYRECFESNLNFPYHFIDERGHQKLKTEFPDIWKQFELDQYV